MPSILFKDGAIVFDGGAIVFTDAPEDCACCDGPTDCCDEDLDLDSLPTSYLVDLNTAYPIADPLGLGGLGGCISAPGPIHTLDGTGPSVSTSVWNPDCALTYKGDLCLEVDSGGNTGECVIGIGYYCDARFLPGLEHVPEAEVPAGSMILVVESKIFPLEAYCYFIKSGPDPLGVYTPFYQWTGDPGATIVVS